MRPVKVSLTRIRLRGYRLRESNHLRFLHDLYLLHRDSPREYAQYLIAEDVSDVDVIKNLFGRYRKLRKHRFEYVAAGGCSKIRAKCRSYVETLVKRGCTRVIVVHDADARGPVQLRQFLEQALHPPFIKLQAIIIPVHEIEAWLLSDEEAVKSALKIKGRVKRVKNPEAILNAKEHLRDLIYRWSEKEIRYVNTVHNAKIAARCEIKRLKKCQSFRYFDSFVVENC